jgi:hypothetical protein
MSAEQLQCSMETMKVGIIKWNRCAKSGKMQTVAMSYSVLPTKMLFRILLTSLVSISSTARSQIRVQQTLAGLPTFWPMTFHLFASYSLIAASSEALFLLVSTRSP